MAGFFRLGWLISTVLFHVPAIAQDAPPVRFNVTEFVVAGENPFTAEQSRAVLEPFIGEHEGLEGLLEAAAELESALLAAGHSFHRVVLPPQTLQQGRIRLEVVVFTLAEVAVTGNEHFSEENLLASLPGLERGKVPDTRELARQLIIANDHPSKDVVIRIKQSRTPDSVDAELAVQDRRPWQFFASLNNIGTDETGDYRVSAGYQHTNLLDLDDTITLSYTTSPDNPDDVKQWGVNYQMPLYNLSGRVALFYSRSDVDSGRVEQVFDVSGAGKFLGGRYTHTFHNIGTYRHRFSVGVDDKLFTNDISFQGTPIGIDVRSRPFTASYSGEYRWERSILRGQVSYVRNLPGGSRNSDTVYAAARAGAEQGWEAFRFHFGSSYTFEGEWLVSASIGGQVTGEPLISGEQFGLGGVNSVRGFEERAVTGDTGYQVSLAAWTPPLPHDVRALAFLDVGRVHISEPAAGQFRNDTLASAGVGLRWRWREHASLSVDYAHEFEDAKTAGAGGSQAHFNLFVRY